MRKISLLGIALGISLYAAAYDDEYIIPQQIEDFYLQRLSRNGAWATGQDGIGSFTVGHDILNEYTYWYPACFPGDGNCISNNGLIVGQEMQVTGMYAVVMKEGETIVTNPLKIGGYSIFDAITPDGTRACGYIANPKNVGPLFIPFYCDINSNGIPGNPVMLPCPELDMFGNRAQYVLAGCISDDGKTIAGLVTDDTGGFTWPIIFRQADNGDWSYSQPTEVLFNPDNETLPENPDNNLDRSDEPHPEDYMTPEQIEDYHKALQDHGGNYDAYWNFMSDEAYREYYNAHVEWAKSYGDRYYSQLEKYQSVMRSMGRDQHFGGILHISADGKRMLTAKSGAPYMFNLEDDSFERFPISTPGFSITQMLPDGTYMGCSIVGYSPYISYICPAGSDKFVKLTDYLNENRPSYLYWLEDSFFNTGEAIVTGAVFFSEDHSVMAGGYYDGEGGALSYIFRPWNSNNEDNAVESITGETDSPVEIYNMNGIRLNNLKNVNDLKNLPKGIYIVNGKKIAV